MDTSAYFTSFMYAPTPRDYSAVTAGIVPHYGPPPHGTLMGRHTPNTFGGRGGGAHLIGHPQSQGSVVARPTCLFANKQSVLDHPLNGGGGGGQPMVVSDHQQVVCPIVEEDD